jgi:hypothetical protein
MAKKLLWFAIGFGCVLMLVSLAFPPVEIRLSKFGKDGTVILYPAETYSREARLTWWYKPGIQPLPHARDIICGDGAGIPCGNEVPLIRWGVYSAELFGEFAAISICIILMLKENRLRKEGGFEEKTPLV